MGSESKPTNNNFDIIRANSAAWDLGPSSEHYVLYAVNSGGIDLDTLVRDYSQDFNITSDEIFHMAQWIASRIGNGDPNCGNFLLWAILVMSANQITIRNLSEIELPHFPKIPTEDCVRAIYNGHFAARHPTACRIPELDLHEDILHVLWPSETPSFNPCFWNPSDFRELPMAGEQVTCVDIRRKY